MRFRPTMLLVSVALVAALIGHVAIDILGDYLLAHDTYDDIDHSSRLFVALLTAVPTLLGIALALRALVREANGSENAFCVAIRSALPSGTVIFTIAAVVVSAFLLCSMEGCDAIIAGQPIDDIGDLFGGSIALGGVTIAVAAVVVALSTLRCLRRLSQLRIVAGAVVAFVRRNVSRAIERPTDFEVAHRLIFHTCDICHRVAGRAPPLRTSVTPM